MRKLIHKFPITSKFILAIFLFGSALIISGISNKGIIKEQFPYISSILLFLATWYLLKKDSKSLTTLGLNFKLKNLSFLPLGILIGAFAFLIAKFIRAFVFDESIQLNTVLDYETILYAFYTILPTVAVEEFLFRGYLFKKTIEVSNVIIANIIFSLIFMLIHVLDESIMNNKGMIVLMVISIPFGHLLFATALLKSKTLFFSIGLHLGNNWATRHLISNSNSEESVFYVSNIATFETWTPFIVSIFLFNAVFLLVTILIWKWDKILNLKKYIFFK